MKVIKRGTLPSEKVYRGICTKCNTVVECSGDEVSYFSSFRDSWYSTKEKCPVCKTEVIYVDEVKDRVCGVNIHSEF